MQNVILISIRTYKVSRPFKKEKKKRVKQASEKFCMDGETPTAYEGFN